MKEREHKEDDGAHRRQVIGYLTLRRAIGVMGILLPLVLAGVHLATATHPGLKGSISAYYDTDARDFFVGMLFAIGWFLFSYKGYSPQDDRVGDLACVFALGVALFPTSSPIPAIATLHAVWATALFLTLAWFSLVLFTKQCAAPTPRKLKRNRVYRVCGGVILACIALIGIYAAFLRETAVADFKPVFWLETLALWALGVSWITKGEVLWADREE